MRFMGYLGSMENDTQLKNFEIRNFSSYHIQVAKRLFQQNPGLEAKMDKHLIKKAALKPREKKSRLIEKISAGARYFKYPPHDRRDKRNLQTFSDWLRTVSLVNVTLLQFYQEGDKVLDEFGYTGKRNNYKDMGAFAETKYPDFYVSLFDRIFALSPATKESVIGFLGVVPTL